MDREGCRFSSNAFRFWNLSDSSKAQGPGSSFGIMTDAVRGLVVHLRDLGCHFCGLILHSFGGNSTSLNPIFHHPDDSKRPQYFATKSSCLKLFKGIVFFVASYLRNVLCSFCLSISHK